MKPILTLAAALLLGACENPITHFTEPPEKGETHVIPRCPVDTLRGPLPPGYRDSTACGR